MNNFQNSSCSGEKSCLVKEMVNDHPWLWVAALFLAGIFLGRHRCCRKKAKKN